MVNIAQKAEILSFRPFSPDVAVQKLYKFAELLMRCLENFLAIFQGEQ
jgi:hypothetical protein